MTATGGDTRPTRTWAAYVDLINVVAIGFVIFLHLRIAYWNPSNTPSWWFENVVSGLGVMAVPLFFMNSGRNLIGFIERESIPTFFRRRLTKVLIPYFAWAQLYLIFHWAVGAVPSLSIQQIIGTMVNGSSSAATLWYMEALLGIYLIIPLASLAISGARRRGISVNNVLLLMVLVSLSAAVLLPAVRRFMPGFMGAFQIPFGGGFFVYAVLGYWLNNVDLSRHMRGAIYILGFLGFASFVLAGGWLMLAASPNAALFNDYLSAGTVLSAAAVFTAARHSRIERWPTGVKRSLQKLAELTFGVYLVHLMVIEAAALVMPLTQVRFDVIYTIAVWLVSLVVVWLLRLVKPFRLWLVP